MKQGRKHLHAISLGVLLFCFFLCVYALTIYGRLRYGDETERYLQAQSLVERQSWEIRRVPGHEAQGVGGNYYSQFELGYGLLLIPAYVLGAAVSSALPHVDRDWIPTLFTSLVNPLITALTCAVVFHFSRSLGTRKAAAVATSILFGLGTLALPYTRGLYREATQGLTLLLSVYGVSVFRHKAEWKWFWLSAISFGYLVFTKVSNLALLPVFMAYVVIMQFAQTPFPNCRLQTRCRLAFQRLFLFLVPLVVFLTIQGIVNQIKFGDFLDIGPYNYRSPLSFFSLANLTTGIWGLVISPDKGLLLYAPPVILFFIALPMLYRRARFDALFLTAIILISILYNASYRHWDGGTYWGTRYLVPIVPLMVLPFGMFLDSTKGRMRWFALLVGVLVFLAGFSVQILGGLVGDREFSDVTGQPINILGAFDFLRHGIIDSLWVNRSVESGAWQANPYGELLILSACLFGLWLVTRALSKDEDEKPSFSHNVALLGIVFAVLFAVLSTQVVAIYPAVRTAQGGTRFVAAESLYYAGRYCEAKTLYLTALVFGTDAWHNARARVDEITPGFVGEQVDIGDMMAYVESPNNVEVGYDLQNSFSGEGALRINVPGREQVSMAVTTEFISVRPNTRYELSGWLKTEGVYGSGYAVLSLYEDDARWRNPQSTDIVSATETAGWHPFRRVITTLPTSHRVMLKTGFWQAYGTVWVDSVGLVQIDERVSSVQSLCSK